MSLYTSKLNFEESSDDGREKQIRVAVDATRILLFMGI